MEIIHDPKDFVVVETRRICEVHKADPDTDFAGCTCNSTYALRRRPPTSQEVAEVAVKHGVMSRQYEDILHRHLGGQSNFMAQMLADFRG